MIPSNQIPSLSLKSTQKWVDYATARYYRTSEAVMDDLLYDKLIEHLKSLNPDDPRLKRVGIEVDPEDHLNKVRLEIPMGSLNNAMNPDEFRAWFKKFPTNSTFHVSPKMDGASLAVKYEKGKLIQAVTRGDGTVGEDITMNAFSFMGLPHYLDRDWTGWIRGEVILTSKNWEHADPEKSTNPRNLGNGIMRRKDGVGSEYLTFYAFDASITRSFSQILSFVESLGVNTVPSTECSSIEDCLSAYAKYLQTRKDLDYWIDGVVFKVNDGDRGASYGIHDQRPKSQIAFKFPSEGKVTTLKRVVYSVGHTGAIIPTGEVEPVTLGGTKVKNALLNNFDLIREMDIAVGDKVEIIKAGDIIPKIIAVVERPKNREKIGVPAVWEGSRVQRVQNPSGSESTYYRVKDMTVPSVQKAKLNKWISSLDIKGLGETLVEALWNEGKVKSIADLYRLTEMKLATVEIGNGELGGKRAVKILYEIDTTRQLTTSEFLGSIGVHTLGKRRVELVQEAAPGEFDSLEDWLDHSKLSGAAERVGMNTLLPYIALELQRIKGTIANILEAGVTVHPNTGGGQPESKGFKICLTGKMSRPRKEIEESIQGGGHTPVSSVNKETDYLVMADPDSGSSKAKKAAKLGVKVISEAELESLLSGS